MTELQYPIGKFAAKPHYSAAETIANIDAVANCPYELRKAVHNLSEEQLDTPYRSGGWTVRQVVHHVADSHLNAYVRHRWALTENNPTIKPYLENEWAKMPDYTLPVDISLTLLDRLTTRWVHMLRALQAQDFTRTFYHPESKMTYRLDGSVALYAWHGAHHVAHITSLRKRMEW
jgi:uncharacterized damage-inducible protein DinB